MQIRWAKGLWSSSAVWVCKVSYNKNCGVCGRKNQSRRMLSSWTMAYFLWMSVPRPRLEWMQVPHPLGEISSSVTSLCRPGRIFWLTLHLPSNHLVGAIKGLLDFTLAIVSDRRIQILPVRFIWGNFWNRNWLFETGYCQLSGSCL